MDDATIIAIDHGVPGAEEILQAMEERMSKTAQRVDSQASMAQSKIHRFPRGMRGIGGPDDQYIAPSVVAIGPYHHGLPHLEEMEDVKHAAVRQFCGETGRSVDEVYAMTLSMAGEARHCYATGDAAVARLGEAEFAAMMLLDGCFLLHYMLDCTAPLFQGCALSSELSILKDMMLLENQIPWLVLEALMGFMPVNRVNVRGFVAGVGGKFFPKKEQDDWCSCSGLRNFLDKMRSSSTSRSRGGGGGGRLSNEDYTPPHLLGLLLRSQIRGMPAGEVRYAAGSSSFLSSSAVELAQIGVKLTASTEAWFGDMVVTKRLLLGELSLSPVFLNDVTACWLVNMAALEATGGGGGSGSGFVVSSYLSALAMLMDKKEDVHELRGRRVVHSVFSNTQTLVFFKRIGQHLRFGGRYFVVLERIESYKRNRPVRIVAHKFVYNNYKVIAAVLSIASVLVGIFKALRQ